MFFDRYAGPDVRQVVVEIDYSAPIGEDLYGTVGLISVGEALAQLHEEHGWIPEGIFEEGLSYVLNRHNWVRVEIGAFLEPSTSVTWKQAQALIAAGRTHEEIYAAGVAALSACSTSTPSPGCSLT